MDDLFESSGLVFCCICKLFSSNQTAFTTGYNDWKNIRRFAEHENSTSHREAISVCSSLAKQNGRVDAGLFKQLRNEQEYWRNVLKRVVSVVKFFYQKEGYHSEAKMKR
jgi:hypothetical protein